MTVSRSAEVAAGLKSGRLQGVSFPDLLVSLSRTEATGILRLTRDHVEKKLHLDRGRVVFASSSDPDDRLGERLLRDGRITVDRLERAVAELPSERRIGELLVDAGSIDPGDLDDGVVQQLREIVIDLFDWNEGEYEFHEGPLPGPESITLELETGELLLMGIRSIRSFGRIRGAVGPPGTVFGLAGEWERALEGIRLAEGEELLLERLRREDSSVERLCREVFLSNFEIYQTVWGLKLLGAIRERIHRTQPGAATESGRLEERDFAEVLVDLCRDEATGVLYVTSGDRERSFHVLDGCCHFATSNDIEDGLIAYLLRRGVISLSDREETARRLLSNKRVGTILREMGVIDERDLEEMVRQQLLEVVFDTFTWSEGDFAFFSDNLPSIEEITLDVASERLVAEGLCRIDSWRRVEEGCGGLDTCLELTPAYLEILDRMGVGEDEWSVVTALKDGGTPRELCERSTLGDFRVCQILWGLRLLGAVREGHRAAVEENAPLPAAADENLDAERSAALGEDEPEGAELEDAEFEANEQAHDEESVGEAGDDRAEVEEVDDGDEASVEDDRDQTAPVSIPVEDATTGPVPAVEETDPRVPLDATQRISEDDLRAALEREKDEGEEPPAGDRTQWISAETLATALGHRDAEDEREEDADPMAAALEATEDVSSEAIDAREIEEIDEIDEAARTRGMSREEVEAALRGDDSWAPPPGLEDMIGRFNAIQRIVYRAVKTEVGAGAANFIRSCCGDLRHGDTLRDVELQADGTWDCDGLRRAVVDARIDEPWEGYQELIDRELDLLRIHIGDARVGEIERQVRQIESADA